MTAAISGCRNPETLSKAQQTKLQAHSGSNLKTARGYQIRLSFQDLYQQLKDEPTPA